MITQINHTLFSLLANEMIRDIWRLQNHLENPRPRSIHTTIEKSSFRAAYDFLLLREKAGEPLQKSTNWWTEFIAAQPEEQAEIIKRLAQQAKPRRRVQKR
jgi:poly(A) polymerase